MGQDLKLLYYDAKGRAEPIRLAFLIGEIPFEDETFPPKEFENLVESGRLPFAQVPTLTVDGVVCTQTFALMRYAGKLAGLYPRDNDLLELFMDEVMAASDEIMYKMFKYFGPGRETLEKAREQFVKVDVPQLMGGLEKTIKSKSTHDTWLCGDSISVADLSIFYILGDIKHGNIRHVPPQTLDSFPRLVASFEAVCEHPKVKKWLEDHPWDNLKI